MGRWYLCTLKPVGDYFFGGEHIFDLYGEEKSYFIRSERMPNQSTLVGVLRFLVLSGKRVLDDIKTPNNQAVKAKQAELIGKQGFSIDQACKGRMDYGAILSLSPVFLMSSTKSRTLGHRWFPTPLNHVKGTGVYSPFEMVGKKHTDISRESILPVDYNAKKGLTDSYLDIDDDTHPVIECAGDDPVFSYKEYTRISRNNPENGYFKKECVHLRDDLEIAFYCEMGKADMLPEREAVYLGQDKSAFIFRSKELDPSEDGSPIKSLTDRLSRLPGCSCAGLYYAASDIYLPKGVDGQDLLYSIVKKKSFRTLNTATGSDYRSSKKRSPEYQMIHAGSVFYLSPGSTGGIIRDADTIGMKQVGFSFLVRLEG